MIVVKKSLFSVILALLLAIYFLSLSGPRRVFAAQPLEEKDLSEWENYSWEDKLKRGGCNLALAPLEIPYSIQRVYEERGKGTGWTIGLLEGVGRTFLRFYVGAIDSLTFPFDVPDENKGPLLDPEFVWQRKKSLPQAHPKAV